MTDILALIIVVVYLLLGAVINGFFYNYDKDFFDGLTAIVIFWWFAVIPIYFFIKFSDNCIKWFKKKN